MLKVAWAPSYVLPLPPNHRFPMSKYEVLPQQLLYEGTLVAENFFQPEMIARQHLIPIHDDAYVRKLETLALSAQEVRRTGFPLDRAVVDREMCIVNGTLRCAEYALAHGVAMNIAGGTHHAFSDRGGGFCLLNDIAVAANYLLSQHRVRKILVIDLDVHQGDGTAQIFGSDDRVFTFSMHGRNNYPLDKKRSDLDIGLPDGTDDRFYLATLKKTLPELMDKVQPDFIFYQSGVDILATDRLGKLGVTRDGCQQRDKVVLTLARRNSIPIVASMGGGYSENFRDIIEAHANTYRLAQEIYF